MFTAIVLASAALAGFSTSAVRDKPVPAAVQAVPTPVALPKPGTTAALAGTSIGARGVLDANTTDDTIVDVTDDSAVGDSSAELSSAITSLPAGVQLIGYRIMWGLAGLVALGGAAISWFLRDPEAEAEFLEPAPWPFASGRGVRVAFQPEP